MKLHRPSRATVAPLITVLAALTLAVSACDSGPAAGPPEATYSPTQTAAALGDVQSDAGQVVTGSFDNLAGRAAQAIPAGPPAPNASGALPRGIYVWDATADAWDARGPSDDLVLHWSFEDGSAVSHDAELNLDWSVTDPTVMVRVGDATQGTQEVPQDALARLSVDGAEMGRLAAKVAWQDTPLCGAILEPATLTLDGYLGDDAHKVAVHDASLALPVASGVFSTAGTVSGVSGTNDVSFDWDLAFSGAVTRDPDTCRITDANVTSGHVGLGVASNSHELRIAFDADAPVIDDTGMLTSVDLHEGALTIDGDVAVTFEGTLGDANANGVPGDDLQLTFAGGDSMSLESFVQSHFALIASLAGLAR